MKTLRGPHVVVLWGLVALAGAGCALTSKSDPMAPRYFSPERALEAVRARPPAPGGPVELRLGRVTSTSFLDERLVYRDSDHEAGYYLERRWTEAPEHYLRRRLARVLFEERGVHQLVGGVGLTLEVELTALEEIRTPKHLARIQLIARLHDQHVVRWEETLAVDEPVGAAAGGDLAGASVDALGLAMRKVVDVVAERVLGELAIAGAPPSAAVRANAAPLKELDSPRR